VRGQYIHFRCDRHKVEGYEHEGRYPEYKCSLCGNPAKAYWYKGDKWQKLPSMMSPNDILAYPY
jgi:hypothetical protein